MSSRLYLVSFEQVRLLTGVWLSGIGLLAVHRHHWSRPVSWTLLALGVALLASLPLPSPWPADSGWLMLLGLALSLALILLCLGATVALIVKW